ncbi:hypothetical protein [Symmachiella dynata]|uniref:hypothetical protein n=1 Tax=Symmachiella dynata TaxID=2527995 RepID=UPI0030EC67C8
MPESSADKLEPAKPSRPGGQFRWLIDNEPRRMLLPLTGVWVLGLDWLLFGSNSLMGGLATPIIMVLGFLLGGAGTLFFQKQFAKDPLWKAILKALVIGVVVGTPAPVAGTLIGGWILVAAGIGKSVSDIFRK